jgi:glutamyl-tRNA(Gln) amidotransferase subunit E
MPGSARMYPETDVVPARVGEVEVEDVELIEDKIKKVEKLGIGKDLAWLVVKQGKEKFVEDESKKYKKVKPTFIAETVCTSAKQVKRQFNADISPTDEDFTAVFSALEKGELSKSSVLDVLKEGKPAKDVISKFSLMPDSDIEKVIKEIVGKNKGAPFNALMGMAMGKLKGKADGKKVMEILKKLAK